MRGSLKLTKTEQKQVQNALKRLDRSYAKGQIPDRLYRHQRAELLANLQRPRFAPTPLQTNQQSFFQQRRNMEFGPAPVGYWDAHVKRDQPRLMANRSKIRASLLSLHNNEWLNDGFQQALRTSAAARNVEQAPALKAEEELSYFQDTIMQANKLGATVGPHNFANTDIWNEISNSDVVVRALNRLAESVEYTVSRMMRAGLSESGARDAIRAAAMKAGTQMTAEGYSPERAAQIVAMVVRGELSVPAAANIVAQDMNTANQAVAAVNAGNGAPDAMWQNNFDIYAMGPTSSSVSMPQLLEMRNTLQANLEMQNDQSARNAISQQLNAIQQQIQTRQQGMQSIRQGMRVGPRGQMVSNNNGGAYNPSANYGANTSTMEITAAAIAKGGPDLWNIVDDIVTVDGVMYFDYMAGGEVSIASNGTSSPVTNNSNPDTVFPAGSFTLYAAGASSLAPLENMRSALNFALMSAYIPENEKGYLRYLMSLVEAQIVALSSSAPESLALNQALSNQVSAVNFELENTGNLFAQQNAVQQAANNAANAMNQAVNQGNAVIAQNSVTQNNNLVQQVSNSANNGNASTNNIVPAMDPMAELLGYGMPQGVIDWYTSGGPLMNNQGGLYTRNQMAFGLDFLTSNILPDPNLSQNARTIGTDMQIRIEQEIANYDSRQTVSSNLLPTTGMGLQLPAGGFPSGGLMGGTKGLSGSTSSTMSTRSHGGVRFVNDPRAQHYGW